MNITEFVGLDIELNKNMVQLLIHTYATIQHKYNK